MLPWMPSTPPPLSSLFIHGAVLEDCNEDLMLIAIFMTLLAVVDFTVAQPFFHPKSRCAYCAYLPCLLCNIHWPNLPKPHSLEPGRVLWNELK